jgi:protein-S-isoprenylcysteine O-methyltransferase Ste14
MSVFVYGVISYLIFFGTFLYAAAWIGNLFLDRTLDSRAESPFLYALSVNASLLLVFALQHSVMARRGFKKWWTQFVPKEAERSTYVLFSSLALILMFWLWQPMGGVVWDITNPAGRLAMSMVFVAGILLVLLATFLINHFDLFGLKQVTMYLMGKEYRLERFKTPFLYKFVRHPLYLGWLMTFWAAPTMTVAHLVFALATTAYIFVAIQFEEMDLIHEHGESYRQYREQVPMILPVGSGKRTEDAKPRAKSAVA